VCSHAWISGEPDGHGATHRSMWQKWSELEYVAQKALPHPLPLTLFLFEKPGLAVLVPDARLSLDDFYSEHPHVLLPEGGNLPSAENVIFDPNYDPVLRQHMACAKRESSLGEHSMLLNLFGPAARRAITTLGVLPRRPDLNINIRGKRETQLRVFATDPNKPDPNPRFLEEIAISQCFRRAYPGSQFCWYADNGEAQYFSVSHIDLALEQVQVRGPCPKKENREPHTSREVSVNDVFAEKRFRLRESSEDQPESSSCWLSVKYASAVVTSKLLGLKQDHDSRDEVGGSALYEQEYSYGWEAPCLILELSVGARKWLIERFCRDVSPRLQQAAHNKGSSLRVQQAVEKMRTLAVNDDPSAVALHTMLHQLLKSVPLLLLLSESDAVDVMDDPVRGARDMPSLIRATLSGYLVDATDGGTGVAKALFDNFEECVRFATEHSDSCRSETCKGTRVGCGLCLITNCFDDNVTTTAGFSQQGVALFPGTE
jgi:MrfA Zn-binding domain